MLVNVVTEFAMRNIKKSPAICGDFKRLSSGEKTFTPAINIIPKTTAKEVVIIVDVLKILLLSCVGKNRIIAKSSPNLESSMRRAIVEIKAVAMPTSSDG